MKSILLVILLSLCVTGFLYGDWERVIGLSDSPVPPEKSVIKSDTLGLFIRTMFFGFTKEDTTVEGKNFQRIEIPGEYKDGDTTRAGKPQIPYIRLLIAVPDSCEFNITVYESDYSLFEDYLFYPIPRIVFRDTAGCTYFEEVFTYDSSFYQKDTLYPGKFYEINSDGYWRDQRILEVFLYPIQFNPKQNLLYFYGGIELRIEYSGIVVENENGLGPFEGIGRETLLNYPGIDQESEREDSAAVHYYTNLLDTNNVADYIIVTHYDFLNNRTARKWINNFAEWRVDHNQFDVGIVKVQDIYTYFPPADSDSLHIPLRDFLIYAYENWKAPSMSDGHFAYCLFVGDWDYVPTKLDTSTYDSELWLIAQEEYYRDLCGGSLDDIMLGRWPVKETELQDLITIAQKTLNYEQSPTLGDWRRRGFLIAGDGFGSNVTRSKPYFTDISYDTLVTRYSQNDSLFREAIDTNLNAGEILSLYFGHGGPAGWWGRHMGGHYDTSRVKQLKNGARLPVVLSASCFTAMFQWDHPFYDSTPPPGFPAATCFGEHFLFNSNGGAVTFWGATGISEILDMPKVLATMLRYQDWILGKGLISLGGYKTYCLLGDPALDLGDYTAYPNLPDLVIRPQGIDISLLLRYPYPTNGDTIPIQAAVWNIGGVAVFNVKVKIAVVEPGNDTVYIDTMRIDTIQPRDSAVVITYWNPAAAQPEYYGEIGDCKFIVTADPNDVIEESWEYNNESLITRKIALYPNKSGWPKKVTGFSQPAIANLDNAYSIEIVYASFDSVYVFDKNGGVFTGWPKYFPGVYGIVLGDINSNGFVEIVAVSPESIKVYNYQGNLLPGWPKAVPASNYRFDGYPSLDISPFPSSKIVVLATKTAFHLRSKAKIFVYSNNGVLQYEDSTTYDTGVEGMGFNLKGASIEDAVSGGGKEIVLSYGYYDSGDTYFYTEVFNDSGSQAVPSYGSNKVISALVDINNDNYADVITGCVDDTIRAYDAENNTLLWKRPTGGPINSSPAVGDINPTPPFPGNEVTFGNDASEIHLRRGVNGDNIRPWWYTTTPNTYVRTSSAIANINGDNYLDIIIGADNGYIYAFKYTKEVISPFPLPLFGQPSSPIIGDIDGDGKSEIIISSYDGYLHIWENRGSSVLPYTLEWPQFHHDYQRTGLYGW